MENKEEMESKIDIIMKLCDNGKLEAMQLCDLSSHRLMYDILIFAYRTDDAIDGPYIILDYMYGATNYIPGNEIEAIMANYERVYDALKEKKLI